MVKGMIRTVQVLVGIPPPVAGEESILEPGLLRGILYTK
jgi:hypothetical protein